MADDTLLTLLERAEDEWPRDETIKVLVAHESEKGLSRSLGTASVPDRSRREEAYLRVVATALVDHELTPDELLALRFLRTALDIQEQDLFTNQRAQVQALVSDAMYVILADLDTSRDEQLLKDGLQEALGLGADDFASLGAEPMRDAIQRILKDIDPWNKGLTDKAFAEFARQATRVEATFPAFERESATPHRRHIPQHVKDAVWRRDQGRCVACSSDVLLEFDHIIPFSKGGASTYRNVQLLCQSCNRQKSAGIG